jgi:DNA-binding NtrC family response regulator
VDVRIVAATNRNLEDLLQQGKFREDLYYRINVVSLYLLPLRERREDSPLLAKHFLAKRLEEDQRPHQEFSKEAMEVLIKFHWPGNIRELENVIEQALVWSNGATIAPEHFPSTLKADIRSDALREDVLTGQLPLEKAVVEFERKIILEALKRTDYVQTHAAALLGISRRILKYRMDSLGIGKPDLQGMPEQSDVLH